MCNCCIVYTPGCYNVSSKPGGVKKLQRWTRGLSMAHVATIRGMLPGRVSGRKQSESAAKAGRAARPAVPPTVPCSGLFR